MNKENRRDEPAVLGKNIIQFRFKGKNKKNYKYSLAEFEVVQQQTKLKESYCLLKSRLKNELKIKEDEWDRLEWFHSVKGWMDFFHPLDRTKGKYTLVGWTYAEYLDTVAYILEPADFESVKRKEAENIISKTLVTKSVKDPKTIKNLWVSKSDHDKSKENKIIPSLYDHFKNTPKPLKIVCDWDEVIQAHEPYALYKGINNPTNEPFPQFFKSFWNKETIEYSPYGSKIKENNLFTKEQTEIKNSPNFYQEAPFLTIAEDLLKLIKEGKVERLIFLSAYDKRKFPNGDERKSDIFRKTFGGFFVVSDKVIVPPSVFWLRMVGFDSETQGQTKTDWIKENASDFDIVIDDNPYICKEIVKSLELRQCPKCIKETEKEKEKWNAKLLGVIHPAFCSDCPKNRRVFAPYYPAVEHLHDRVILDNGWLIKQEVSDLRKEDFTKI